MSVFANLICFEIRREFQRFDENEDGLINQDEFGQFLRGIGLIPSDDEVKVGTGESKFWSDVDQKIYLFITYFFQEIYEQIDKNNDGTIEFEEFVTVLDHPKVNLSR